MKFNCDKAKQRNKKKLEEFWDTHANKWVEEFAWWPVRVAEGDCRWLEMVEVMWVPWVIPEESDRDFRLFLGQRDVTREIFVSNTDDAKRAVNLCGNWVYRPLDEVRYD